MVLEEFLLHAFFLLGLHVADDGSDFVLHALQAHIFVQLGKNLFLILGNEAFRGVDVLGFHRLASAVGGFHVDGLCHLLCQVTVGVAEVCLAHIPGEVGLELGCQVVGDVGHVFVLQELQGQLGKISQPEGRKDEVELKEPVDVFVVL